jgi:multidrug resistance efflux pump
VQLATDRITFEDLSVEVKIAEGLLRQEAIAPYELQRVEVQHETMAEKIRKNEDMLEQAEADLEQAQHRRDEFAHRLPQHPSVDSALEVIHKQVKVQEQRMEELLARRKPLNLTTPFDGMVSLIQHWPGEAVQANEPILTITELKPTDIVAYAKNDQIPQIREGMVVEIVRNTEPSQIARSQVISVGPAVEQMPIQLWLNPNIPEWGRPFVIKAPPQMKLIIGERVGIRTL